MPYRPYWKLCHQFWCQPIRLPEDNKSDSTRTGDSIGHLVSLNSIPPTWRPFVLLYKSSIQFIGEKSLDMCEILPFWVHKINCKKCYLLPGGKNIFFHLFKESKVGMSYSFHWACHNGWLRDCSTSFLVLYQSLMHKYGYLKTIVEYIPQITQRNIVTFGDIL